MATQSPPATPSDQYPTQGGSHVNLYERTVRLRHDVSGRLLPDGETRISCGHVWLCLACGASQGDRVSPADQIVLDGARSGARAHAHLCTKSPQTAS